MAETTQAVQAKPKRGMSKSLRDSLVAYSFIAPNFIGFCIFTLVPMIFAIGLSFCNWDGVHPVEFTGISNFVALLSDKTFKAAFVRITGYLLFLLLQTNHIHRIHTHTILHNLKMQVETCAVAGIAYITYNLPCRYRFPCGNGSLRHVGVPRGQARAVIQQNLIAVAVVPAADQHRTAVGSQDGCTLRRGNVRTAMPGITVSVVVTKIAGNIGLAGQRPA